jgi:hypothetical protein
MYRDTSVNVLLQLPHQPAVSAAAVHVLLAPGIKHHKFCSKREKWPFEKRK